MYVGGRKAFIAGINLSGQAEGPRSRLGHGYHLAGIWGFRDYLGLPAAWCDYDNDGDLDLLTGGKLYQNRTPGGHWLLVTLRANGSAVGAQARIRLGDRADEVEIEIRWPGAARQSVRSAVDRAITITRG